MNCFVICDAALNQCPPQALVFGRKTRNPRGCGGWLPDSASSHHRGSAAMSDQEKVNRRDFIATSTALGSTALTSASAQSLLAPPPGFDTQKPLIDNWNKQLGALVDVSVNLRKDAPELEQDEVKE